MTDNELIAEFMGINVRYSGIVLYHCDPDGYIDFVDGADTYSPQKSWSDLMPVVEKIHTLGLLRSDILLSDYYRELLDMSIVANIEIIYQKVIEFIKWHNEQKSVML